MTNLFCTVCVTTKLCSVCVAPTEEMYIQYALSTKRCMLGNQDRSLARVVLFLLCWPILLPLEVISRAVYDDFTQLIEVRNFSHIHSTF